MIKKEDKKLTEKQRKFLKEYIKSGDVKVSALKAGYSKNNALKMGEENLKKENARKYIKKALKSDITENKKILNEKIEDTALSYKNKIEKDIEGEKCSEQDKKFKSKKDFKDTYLRGYRDNINDYLKYDSKDFKDNKKCTQEYGDSEEIVFDDCEIKSEKKEEGFLVVDNGIKKETNDEEISISNKKGKSTLNNKNVIKGLDDEECSDLKDDLNLNEKKFTEKIEYEKNFNDGLMDKEDKKKSIADEEEVMEYLTSLIRGSGATEREKLKAAELMGKRYGMWSEKIDLSESCERVITVDVV